MIAFKGVSQSRSQGAKGKKYTRVTSDKRRNGARRRSYAAAAGQQTASSSKRNTFKGYQDLSALANGITESKDTSYNQDSEKKIMEVNKELKMLISGLEKNKNGKKDKVSS